MKFKEAQKEFKEIIGKSMKANERNSKFVKYENTMSNILNVDMFCWLCKFESVYVCVDLSLDLSHDKWVWSNTNIIIEIFMKRGFMI